MAAVKIRKGWIFQTNPNPIVANIIADNTRGRTGINPAAIGRYFLVGCARSFSKSIRSLVIYTALDNKQNPRDTTSKSINWLTNVKRSDDIASRFSVNKKGRKINKFLTHWRALKAVKSNKKLRPKCLTPSHIKWRDQG